MSSPAGWALHGGVLARGDVTQPSAIAEVSPIASVPDSDDVWVALTLGHDVRVLRSDELAGRDGWRARIVVCERVIGVYVRFLDDLGACVIVRGGDLEAAAKELLPCVAAATPGWRADGEVIAISDLFEERI